MPPIYEFFTPTELPIVGEKFSAIKCENGKGNTEFNDAEVIAYFPRKENVSGYFHTEAYIIIKAHLGKTFMWEVYVHESNLHTWRFKY